MNIYLKAMSKLKSASYKRGRLFIISIQPYAFVLLYLYVYPPPSHQ